MRANLCRLRDVSFAILFNFCGQFHNARRFGGTLCVTPSPFPAACDETQHSLKHHPFNALHLWRTSTSDLTPRRGSAACTARRFRHDTPQSVLASLWYFAGTPIHTGKHPSPPTSHTKHTSILHPRSFHAKMKAPREVSHEKDYTYIYNCHFANSAVYSL